MGCLRQDRDRLQLDVPGQGDHQQGRQGRLHDQRFPHGHVPREGPEAAGLHRAVVGAEPCHQRPGWRALLVGWHHAAAPVERRGVRAVGRHGRDRRQDGQLRRRPEVHGQVPEDRDVPGPLHRAPVHEGHDPGGPEVR